MKKIILRKIKEGKVKKIRDWCNALMCERYDEAVASLKYENVQREFAYIVELHGEYYLVLYMESIEKDVIREADSSMRINNEHIQVLYDCLEFGNEGECLYDISI